MAKTTLTTISIPVEVAENPGFLRLTESRKLSSVISELLYNYLNISRSDNKGVKKLQDQMSKLDEKKDFLAEQIKKLQEEEKEELAQEKLNDDQNLKIAAGIKMSGMHRRMG